MARGGPARAGQCSMQALNARQVGHDGRAILGRCCALKRGTKRPGRRATKAAGRVHRRAGMRGQSARTWRRGKGFSFRQVGVFDECPVGPRRSKHCWEQCGQGGRRQREPGPGSGAAATHQAAASKGQAAGCGHGLKAPAAQAPLWCTNSGGVGTAGASPRHRQRPPSRGGAGGGRVRPPHAAAWPPAAARAAPGCRTAAAAAAAGVPRHACAGWKAQWSPAGWCACGGWRARGAGAGRLGCWGCWGGAAAGPASQRRRPAAQGGLWVLEAGRECSRRAVGGQLGAAL